MDRSVLQNNIAEIIDSGGGAKSIVEYLGTFPLYESVSLVEGTPVQFLGVYCLKWGKANKPTHGFVDFLD